MSERRRRQLRPEERVLWETVARTARPLHGAPEAFEPDDEPEFDIPWPEPATPADASARESTAPPAKRLEPIDRRLRTKLGRGTAAVDGRLDLHGLTQREAHAALKQFLAEAQRRRAKLVLVITGKGRPESVSVFEDARGVLRRAVPQWLASPEFRPYVGGFDEAHRTHGGGGALYVRIRQAAGGG